MANDKDNPLIVVTGGAGLIGSAIVWQLNQLGIHQIIIVDHLGESDKWKNLRALKYLDYYEKDAFINQITCNKLPYPIQSIFHMGACSATTEKDASYLVQNNFEYTRDLAMYALKRGIRFIYASSAATYGDGTLGYADSEDKIELLRPLNMYGYSKQMFDLWAKNHGLFAKITGLKFFNVFGPNEWHKGDMRSMVVKAYEQIVETGRIKLFKSYVEQYGDGEQQRDFIYVKDAAKMAVHFLLNPQANGLFNIGTGKANSWNNLAEAVFLALQKPVQIDYIDMPEQLQNKYQYYTCAELQKLRHNGYTDTITSLREAVRDYVQNYLKTGHHLGDI